MSELSWVAEARKHIGLKEKINEESNPTIIAWLNQMGTFSSGG